MSNPKFSFIANNKKYDDAFEDVSIYMSMETVSNDFEASTTNYYLDVIANWGIKLGDEFKVSVNDEDLINGYLDEVKSNTSANSRKISFSGRDKTADLVDCPFVSTSNENGNFKNSTVKQIIEKLCSPFNIQVSADKSVSTELNKSISKFNVEEGSNILDVITRLCLKRGILPMSIGDGKLTLTRATSSSLSLDVISNQKIISKDVFLSDRERFNHYFVKGQSSGKPSLSKLSKYIQPAGEFKDNNIKRYRPYLIIMDDNADDKLCEDRAKFESNQRAASSRSAEIVLQGWTRFDNNKVWRPNSLVSFEDELLGGKVTMLISEVELAVSSATGFSATLSLIQKDAYSLKDAAALAKSGFDVNTRLGSIN